MVKGNLKEPKKAALGNNGRKMEGSVGDKWVRVLNLDLSAAFFWVR